MPGAALVLALALSHAQPLPASLQPSRGMTIATPPSVEVMIARRVDDGTLETACVDNDEAARAFFARAPKAKAVAKPEEQ
jgi:hypothetical protein